MIHEGVMTWYHAGTCLGIRLGSCSCPVVGWITASPPDSCVDHKVDKRRHKIQFTIVTRYSSPPPQCHCQLSVSATRSQTMSRVQRDGSLGDIERIEDRPRRGLCSRGCAEPREQVSVVAARRRLETASIHDDAEPPAMQQQVGRIIERRRGRLAVVSVLVVARVSCVVEHRAHRPRPVQSQAAKHCGFQGRGLARQGFKRR